MTANNPSRGYLGGLSVIGLIVVLAIAGGLDALLTYLRHLGPTLALFSVVLWAQPLGSLLLAALLLLLFWFALTRAPRNVWIAALYLLVGLYLAFFLLLYQIPAIGSWLPPAFYGVLLSVNSYTSLAGSFIAVIGLFMLVLPRRKG